MVMATLVLSCCLVTARDRLAVSGDGLSTCVFEWALFLSMVFVYLTISAINARILQSDVIHYMKFTIVNVCDEPTVLVPSQNPSSGLFQDPNTAHQYHYQ